MSLLMINDDEYFKLFECCQPVKGISYSIIMDLQRDEYLKIPNLLNEVLKVNKKNNFSIKNLKSYFKNKLDSGIDKYLKFLIEEEYGFMTNEPDKFPELNTDFIQPNKVVSSVINITKNKRLPLYKIIKELDFLGCQTLQVRFFKDSFTEPFLKIIESFNRSSIRLIELYIEDSLNLEHKLLERIIKENLRVRIIVFSSRKKNHLSRGNYQREVVYTEQNLYTTGKEIYSERLFTSNIQFFSEAKNFNVGLNKKICIDENGNYKNYLSHKESFGNVNNISISEIIKSKEFRKKWKIKNDLIEKCKDCQYRYMCLSNSDVKEEEGKFFKLNYCNYDL